MRCGIFGGKLTSFIWSEWGSFDKRASGLNHSFGFKLFFNFVG